MGKNNLRIHYFQHVPYEGLGCIEDWLVKNNHQISCTQFHKSDELPDFESFDWLIIMGGPMGIYDDDKFDWLKREREFIKETIVKNKIVIGICLGSQFIADALGAKVYKNNEKEIGWFDINLPNKGKENWLFGNFETNFKVFHWHGDTFSLPEKSIHLAMSKGCLNQAFLFGEKVLGLQFHFEVTETSLLGMLENGKEELIENKYIQDKEMIIKMAKEYIPINNQRMFSVLDKLSQKSEETDNINIS